MVLEAPWPAVLLLFLCLTLSVNAQSAIFMVPGNDTNVNCGLSWESPCYGLENSVAQAKNMSIGIIKASSGIYASNTTLTIDFNLEIR